MDGRDLSYCGTSLNRSSKVFPEVVDIRQPARPRHSGRYIAFSVASGRERRTFLPLRLRRREGDVHQFRGAAADGIASQRHTPAVALAPPAASALCSRCPGAVTRCFFFVTALQAKRCSVRPARLLSVNLTSSK